MSGSHAILQPAGGFPALLAMCLAAAVLATPAPGAIIITVGSHLLQPDTPGQVVQVFVSGDQSVSGLNLFAQVGDGGPELANLPNPLPPGTDGPAINTVGLTAKTIFAGVPDVPTDLGSIPQVAIWSLALAEPTSSVRAAGTLARLKVDTTGFVSGSWDLLLDGVLAGLANGPFTTNFAGTPADQIANGTITIGDLPGDMDFDGDIDFDDIPPFVLGLTQPLEYQTTFGLAAVVRGDVSGDGRMDFDDIPPFIANFGAAAAAEPAGATAIAAPEPASATIGLIAAAAAVLLGLRVARSG